MRTVVVAAMAQHLAAVWEEREGSGHRLWSWPSACTSTPRPRSLPQTRVTPLVMASDTGPDGAGTPPLPPAEDDMLQARGSTADGKREAAKCEANLHLAGRIGAVEERMEAQRATANPHVCTNNPKYRNSQGRLQRSEGRVRQELLKLCRGAGVGRQENDGREDALYREWIDACL